ncbi:MAG: GNAT family N-acetyltransferase [Bacteroidales bacterium]|nr:GNAT family N-acetyltransferase [Bacteroidales bacterium]
MDASKYDVLSKYGITLKRLTHDKIELVRRWRNDPKISQYMEYRDEITPEMQEKWFQKINNDKNFYFLIEIDNNEIGLINVRDINYEKGQGEPGIFIWDDKYLDSTVSFQSCLCLHDFCFETLGLKELVIHILRDNKRAIKFNKALGYKISDNQKEVYNQEYTLNINDYIEKRNKIKNLLK